MMSNVLPWCDHAEKVPVESGGKVVAWLCTSCNKQLPEIPPGERYMYTGRQIGDLGVPTGSIVFVREVVSQLTKGVGDGTTDAVVVEIPSEGRAWSVPIEAFERDFMPDPR